MYCHNSSICTYWYHRGLIVNVIWACGIAYPDNIVSDRARVDVHASVLRVVQFSNGTVHVTEFSVGSGGGGVIG